MDVAILLKWLPIAVPFPVVLTYYAAVGFSERSWICAIMFIDVLRRCNIQDLLTSLFH